MNYLSFSQCETWNQCPRRWYLTKVERAPQAPSPALIMGSAVHECLELAGEHIIWSKGESMLTHSDLCDTLRLALLKMLKADDPNGLIPDTERREIQLKGAAILAAYVTHLQPRYRPTAVEESFTVDIPGATGWTFTGRIDARVTLADGTIALVDWKSGKAWGVGAEHIKAQASAYLWAEMRQGGPARAVVFCIFPVTEDGEGGYMCSPQFRPTKRTPEDRAAYLGSLLDTAAAIEASRATGHFPARTGPLCAYCGVLGSCATGRQWLADHGRAPAIPMVRREGGEHDAL